MGINYQRQNVGWQNRKRSSLAESILYEGVRQHSDDVEYLKGEDVKRYSINVVTHKWLRHDYEDYIGDGETVSVNHVWANESVKIVTRQTGDRIVAALEENQYYTGRSLHSTKIIDKHYSEKFMLAILNSQVISYMYNILARERGRPLAQVKLKNVRRLPVPKIDFETSNRERIQIVGEGISRYHHYYKTGDVTPVLELVTRQLEEAHTDVVHYLLALQAQKMIDMNKEMQQVTEDFWLDLEGEADPGTFDDLRNKGKWESTLWKTEACQPFVDEESRSTRHLDDSLAWNEEAFKAFVKALAGPVPNLADLVRVYRKHHPRYLELSTRLSRTDHLIDQIVYKLYGLTEEEIAIVEGG